MGLLTHAYHPLPATAHFKLKVMKYPATAGYYVIRDAFKTRLFILSTLSFKSTSIKSITSAKSVKAPVVTPELVILYQLENMFRPPQWKGMSPT